MKRPPRSRACFLDSDKNGIRVEVCPEAGDVIVTAYKGSTMIGQAILEPSPGTRSLKVGEINVVKKRGGVGTRLYEAAVRIGCKAGLAVASDSMRSPFAEAFWRKQVSKGRATCERGPSRVHRVPGDDALGLPRPGENDAGDPAWDCGRYVVRAPCDVPTLQGLRGSGRKRKRR